MQFHGAHDPFMTFLDCDGVDVVAAPAVGMTLPGLLDGQRVVITQDGAGVAEALMDALSRAGIAARVVDVVPPDAEAVLFLGGLRPVLDASVNREAFEAAQDRGNDGAPEEVVKANRKKIEHEASSRDQEHITRLVEQAGARGTSNGPFGVSEDCDAA